MNAKNWKFSYFTAEKTARKKSDENKKESKARRARSEKTNKKKKKKKRERMNRDEAMKVGSRKELKGFLREGGWGW